MSNLPKRLHVTGICGVAMSAVAIAFKEAGVTVTGSDKGFFPPVSTELERHGIDFYAGWHPENMIEKGVPDVVMYGAASGSQNPETLYAKEHGIPMFSYAEIIGKYFAKERCVVCAGTWGKTSSSALLSHILIQAGLDPTYMFGGISLSHEASAHLSPANISVFEGDEYKSSPTDPTAKFFYYKPTHLLLSAVSWDHADLYPTEKSYFDAFKKLLPLINEKGFIVACMDQSGVSGIIGDFKGKTILYGRKGNKHAAYTYGNVMQTKKGLEFEIAAADQSWKITSSLLGLYQAENITGCFAMAHSLGVEADKIVTAISTFKGMRRRMEKRLDGDTSASGVAIIDDIAHSPEKAAAVLATLKSIYPGKVIAVFEPNIGGRREEAAAKYDNAFSSADTVIIPRLTKLKIAENEAERPIEGDRLADIIRKTQPNTVYIEDDTKLVEYLKSNAKKGDVIAFLGSHGFRGMIEQIVLSKQ